ncbi:TMEM175 family protein [uncultured Arcticibacterium sp.]|uniref:TMEM175 family protein n=1 Tax=uncultured Arcticibacterium sp. TaxID=2173042 RepID=UPI0030FA93FD
MRNAYIENSLKDENLTYRGESNTRLNSLTDAIFGIALTLLIFNVSDADSFKDLLVFAKSFPALLVSIAFLYIMWKEHVYFAVLYGIQGISLQLLNVIFTSLIIFYVYPLRFLTRLLTDMLFGLSMELRIEAQEIPELMIYYGVISFSIYFTLFLFYTAALKQKAKLALSKYEIFYSQAHRNRMLVMAVVPFISLSISFLLKDKSILWASVLGGMSYGLYPILMTLWSKLFKRKSQTILEID